ncbi:MAG: hypothetical protein WBG08_10055 [Litorimonas sp.]
MVESVRRESRNHAGDDMRLAGLALSAAMLSACSYNGGGMPAFGDWFSGPKTGQFKSSAAVDRCRVPYRGAPVPRGCHPSQVTVGYGQPGAQASGQFGPASHPGGFPQKPQFGQPQYTHPQQATGGFGTHASGNAHTALHQGGSGPVKRRPRFRASLDLSVEPASDGDLIDNSVFPTSPFAGYDPAVFQEGRSEGTRGDGQTTDTLYYVNSRLQNTPDPWDTLSQPSVSFSDAWSAPASIGFGGEWLVSDSMILFGRVGYTRAEGTSGGAATIEGTVFEQTTVETFADVTDPVTGTTSNVSTGTSTNTAFITEQLISEISYDFSDLERLDLEAGGRFYTKPIAGTRTGQTITPFFGVSAGASHYNAASYTLDQRQLSYESPFEEEENEYYDLDVPQGFDLDNDPLTPGVTRQDLYDAQWVLNGGLQAGVEWQVTPGTALALETGLKYQGGRDLSNGEKSDVRLSVPLTLRGSFNF